MKYFDVVGEITLRYNPYIIYRSLLFVKYYRLAGEDVCPVKAESPFD